MRISAAFVLLAWLVIAHGPATVDGSGRGRPINGPACWIDTGHFGGLRWQVNLRTGQERLLDPRRETILMGAASEVRSRLDELRTAGLPETSPDTVIVIHGLGDSSWVTHKLQQTLTRADWTVVPFDYPSKEIPLATAADYLQRLMASLPAESRLHLVGHSLGGLVIRAALKDSTDPRVTSVVMAGTPNQGADVARMFATTPGYELMVGPVGRELAAAGDVLELRWPAPKVPCLILAGGKGDGEGYSSLIPGDDDGLVSLASTHLSEGEQLTVVPVTHTRLVSDPVPMRAICSFLDAHRCAGDGDRGAGNADRDAGPAGLERPTSVPVRE